jgi:ketosteroid isomerase-like protein
MSPEGEGNAMTEQEVIRTHTEGFYGALKARDFDALSRLYAADYMLVRPDASVLSKEGVLRDLQEGGLMIHSIEISDVRVRIYGETALLTGESRTVMSRAGKETRAHFRLIAVYVANGSAIQLAHFQSVSLPN